MSATIISRNKTSDNKTLQVWSDGDLTQALGYTLKGGRLGSVSVASMVAGEACLFDWAEMPSLLKAAKLLVARKGDQLTPGNLRKLAHKLAEAASSSAV